MPPTAPIRRTLQGPALGHARGCHVNPYPLIQGHAREIRVTVHLFAVLVTVAMDFAANGASADPLRGAAHRRARAEEEATVGIEIGATAEVKVTVARPDGARKYVNFWLYLERLAISVTHCDIVFCL